MARTAYKRKAVVKTRKASRKHTTNANHEGWSDAQYWGFIRAGLRAKFTRYPPKWVVLSEAKRVAQNNPRAKWEYLCTSCFCWYLQKDVTVDHIVPCGSLRSYADLAGFVERLFCPAEGLQVLCKPCHLLKTKADKEKKDENL